MGEEKGLVAHDSHSRSHISHSHIHIVQNQYALRKHGDHRVCQVTVSKALEEA